MFNTKIQSNGASELEVIERRNQFNNLNLSTKSHIGFKLLSQQLLIDKYKIRTH